MASEVSVSSLLEILVREKGSDLHLIAGLPPAIRVNGELAPIAGTAPVDPEELKRMVYAILSAEQIEAFEFGEKFRNELDFALSVNGLGRFRFNVHRQRGTVGAVARALSTQIPRMELLGLPQSASRFCTAKKGLALVTGPTGSGKTTTLAAIIDRINETRADHILTIEDPIEYLHNTKKSYITQREVGPHADTMSFANALKFALRQDPDVILVGEMRDYETIGIAITSAETGHMVFGTLHTSSAAQTVGRIIDVFPSDQQPQVTTQLASSLFGVLSQILLPRMDGNGRCLCAEVMFVTPGIRNQIRSNSVEGVNQSIQTGAQDGMQTMDQCITERVLKGIVDYAVAKPHVKDAVTHRTIVDALGEKESNSVVYSGSVDPRGANGGNGSGGRMTSALSRAFSR